MYYYNVRFITVRPRPGVSTFGIIQFNDTKNKTRQELRDEALAKAVELLAEGKLGVYVTELLYGTNVESAIWEQLGFYA